MVLVAGLDFVAKFPPFPSPLEQEGFLRAEVYDAAEKAQSASPSSCNSIPTSTKGLSLYPGYIGLSLFCGRVCNSLSG